jgi:hypothetical protein
MPDTTAADLAARPPIRFRHIAFLLLLISPCCFGDDQEFAVGQVWAYKTRDGEEASRLVIDKVEEDVRLGQIFHISVTGLEIRVGGSIFTRALPHLPVSLKTLKLSCTKLIEQSVPNPDYLPGYSAWRQAFDAGHAGIYTISVADIVSLAEVALSKSRNQQPVTNLTFIGAGSAARLR